MAHLEQPKQPSAERSKALLRMYGKLPAKRSDLLHHQLDERKYFDSGDFALSLAGRSSNIGSVDTGSEHPLRGTIPLPACPVPSSSNVEEHAADCVSKHTAAHQPHTQWGHQHQHSERHEGGGGVGGGGGGGGGGEGTAFSVARKPSHLEQGDQSDEPLSKGDGAQKRQGGGDM
ncbi:hypothetical protein QBC35DRAFT_93446 [Podospora australis]|uniref:mRNA stability protein n=1 Tax=Podospora australis TaxID=1536484 RepID=A0AAN6WLK9_9PEZI|nr:hypothetical protein QBC35DRAFT_93446 [Podospora australis]